MNANKLSIGAAIALCLGMCAAFADEPSAVTTKSTGMVGAHRASDVTPGLTTKAQVRALLGAPWRIVQFNDCGHAMPGQSDETWEYRGSDAQGTYRLHVEFDDNSVARLVAKIPDSVPGGKGTAARAVPPTMMAHNHM
jgi:outer membrane protein assembly factor BamE (lipoprotein component of BamABCDE complex)